MSFDKLVGRPELDWNNDKTYELGKLAAYKEIKDLMEFIHGG